MIPVIFIHKGTSSYLNYTLLKSCQKNKTFLISDVYYSIQSSNYEHINSTEIQDGFDEFAKNYVHMNTTDYNYELFCFRRWFILKKFMEEHNLDIVFYVDSDVLLFTNANEEWEKYKQFDITLLHRTAATSSFITKRAIDNFCNFLINTYINKTSYEYKKIESHFMVRRDCGLPGGVCDMTFLDYFHYHFNVGGGPGRVGEMMTIIDGSTYDHNINAQDQDFELSNGIKNIKVINKVPYVFNIKLNQDIKLNAIHFQGNAKHLIKQYYQLTT